MLSTEYNSQKSRCLRAISDYYGLEHCFLVHELGLWGAHLRCRLRTRDGKHLLLKEKPYYLRNDEFEFHLRLHIHIQRRNGPVVPLLSSTAGELVFAWESHQFELQEWIEGRHLSPEQPNDLQELGSLVARFQIAALGFESKYVGNWNFPQNRPFTCPERWPEILEYVNHVDRALMELYKHGSHALSWLRDWIRRHGNSIEQHELPEQFIHGDVDCFNCIVDSLGNSVLVDLDDAHWGYRITDIASSAAIVGGIILPSEDVPARVDGNWRWDNIEQVLVGFENHSHLTDIERACFNDFLGLNLVRSFVSCLNLDDPSIRPQKDLPSQVDALIAMLKFLK